MVVSRYVGARVRRKEDPRLITGSSQYVDDIKLPGMLHVAFVRSSYPHARIRGIDASAAQAMPSVIADFTGRDLAAQLKGKPELLPGEAPHPEEQKPEGIPVPPEEPIAVDRALYVGQPIAVVVATSAAAARDAAEAVTVDYEPLPAVIDPEQAVQDGAHQLYPDIRNNIGERWERKHGDVESAFAQAHVVVKQRFRQQRLAGIPMEPRAIVAAPDPLTRGVTVWSSTQAPHWNRNALAAALGLAHGQVRIIAPEVGGGFGVKIGAYQEDFILAALALKLHRPVKWVETRAEHLLATNHGRDQVVEYELAADANGRVLGLRARIVQNLGAYPLDHRPHGLRLLRHTSRRHRGLRRLHQHDGGRGLPRRRTSGGSLLHRTNDGPLGPPTG